MLKGGYKLVDLHDTALTVGANAVTISGVYDAIENNYRKPIILTGLMIGDVECSDRYVNFRPTTNGLVCSIGFNDSYEHLMLIVGEDDGVRIVTQ